MSRIGAIHRSWPGSISMRLSLVCPQPVYYFNRSRRWKRQRLSARYRGGGSASMAEKSDKAKGEKRFDIEEDLSKVEVPDVLPVLPLRGIVIFPNQIHPFLVSRPASLKLIEDVGQASRVIGLSAQKNPEEENPAPEGLFPRGTAGRILKM